MNPSLYLVVCIATQLLGLSVFYAGFFPFKSSVQGSASPDDFPSDPSSLPNPSVVPPFFDRMVFVLIDALREDFAECSEDTRMDFICGLLADGRGRAFRAMAHSPTVTMPRIKALMSGGIPGFMDVVMNFGSSAMTADNLITQLHRHGKKLAFYGDETWLRLFPEHFMRSEGTTSFFVADYTEVDDNVTRHLDHELSFPFDWDLLVLHYLGLDHIGHLAGPGSPLVSPKLREMDAIVERIFASLQVSDERSLIVVCGDHGMTAEGGHGGSSLSETATPLILLSSHWPSRTVLVERSEILQIDTTPTLASLLGVPIPQNNLGVLIPDAFEGFPSRTKLSFAFINAQQITQVLKQSVSDISKDFPESSYHFFQRASSAHSEWLLSSSDNQTADLIADKILQQYTKAMKMMREKLASSLTQYDLYAMTVGIALIWMVLLTLITSDLSEQRKPDPVITAICGALFLLSHTAACTSRHASPLLCDRNLPSLALVFVLIAAACFLLSTLVATSRSTFEVFHSKVLQNVRLPEFFVCAGTVGHAASVLSTSCLEEEHQIWYYWTLTIFFLMALMMILELKSSGSSVRASAIYRVVTSRPFLALVLLMALCRVARAWNRTGDKWKDLPDIGDWLMQSEHQFELSLLASGSLFVLALLICQSVSSLGQKLLCCVCCVSIYCHRTQNGPLWLPLISHDAKGVIYARIAYFCILSSVVCKPRKQSFWSDVQTSWLLLTSLLLRAYNLPLVAIYCLQSKCLGYVLRRQRQMSPEFIAVVYTWMGHAAFFYQGNSNSISSVDVSAGYVGLQDYQPLLIALLMVLATYAGPIFWFISLMRQLTQLSSSRQHLLRVVRCLLILRALPLSVFITFITCERFHLFIWSVFSPKLLYEGSHLVISSLLCLCLLAQNFFFSTT